jgi:hypothetical protein
MCMFVDRCTFLAQIEYKMYPLLIFKYFKEKGVHFILNLSYVEGPAWSELLDIQSARYDTNRMVPDNAKEE